MYTHTPRPDLLGGPHGWPEIDTSLLGNGRGAVPPFLLDLLPQPRRDWMADRARPAGAPVRDLAGEEVGREDLSRSALLAENRVRRKCRKCRKLNFQMPQRGAGRDDGAGARGRIEG
jgi:hypothetical protein